MLDGHADQFIVGVQRRIGERIEIIEVSFEVVTGIVQVMRLQRNLLPGCELDRDIRIRSGIGLIRRLDLHMKLTASHRLPPLVEVAKKATQGGRDGLR